MTEVQNPTCADNIHKMQLKKYFQKIHIQTKNKYLRTYLILAALRVFLVFVPQSGYIHPDEFFQSVEIVAGKLFQSAHETKTPFYIHRPLICVNNCFQFFFSGEEYNLEHTRTWEFNSTFPIRSIALPYIVYKIPLNVFRLLSAYARHFFDIDLRSTYALLVFPRTVMCALSFVNDWSLYQICVSYGLRYDVRLLALASSFVTLVFGTRTFSNSIEMAMCSLLLYIVADCMVHSNTVIMQREFLDERYKASTTTIEKVKVYKLRSVLPAHTINKCPIIALLFVAGCFNRPTFLFFGMPVVFFWMLRGLGSKTVTFLYDFNLRVFTFAACALPVLVAFILIDSMYYGFLTLADIDYLDIGMNNFVVTPLNFIRYNIDPLNTGEHGVHPKYLHLLVNIPLLFNVLGVAAVFSFGHMIYK